MNDPRGLDALDPLAWMREEFHHEPGGPIYLDGHSLGRLPRAVAVRLREMVDREWGEELVTGWERWVDWPLRVGDRLGESLLGAAPGQVVVCDSTTVNLYKLVAAALQRRPGDLVTDQGNFPTDRYVLQGLASAAGVQVRHFEVDFDSVPDPAAVAAAAQGASLVCLSLVDFRSGALADMRAINDACRASGALVCWDLSHAVGAVEIDLDSAGCDLAVGCTYKYVNAGPGAPGFAYVSTRLQVELRQPIWGWFGQAEMFVMGPAYEPFAGIGQLLTGTPSILGLAAVDSAISVLEPAGQAALREKSRSLVSFALERAEGVLAGSEVKVAGPRLPEERGAHVTLRCPDAPALGAALQKAGVLVDVRPPDLVRLGLAPAYTRFVDVADALDRLGELLHSGR